jgi:hypothetical protein
VNLQMLVVTFCPVKLPVARVALIPTTVVKKYLIKRIILRMCRAPDPALTVRRESKTCVTQQLGQPQMNQSLTYILCLPFFLYSSQLLLAAFCSITNPQPFYDHHKYSKTC